MWATVLGISRPAVVPTPTPTTVSASATQLLLAAATRTMPQNDTRQNPKARQLGSNWRAVRAMGGVTRAEEYLRVMLNGMPVHTRKASRHCGPVADLVKNTPA